MRLRFMFWLDLDKPHEREIADQIAELKQNRSFAKTIRDGLRLIQDLRKGQTEVLKELFPWVLEAKTVHGVHDFSRMHGFEARFERMEQLFLESKQASPPPRNPSPIESSLPELEIKKAQSDENPTFNIMLSSLGMGILKVSDLPAECIEYGIQKGRLDASHRKQKGGPRAMDVPAVKPPSFDDLQIDC